jgi:hypothetical protein
MREFTTADLKKLSNPQPDTRIPFTLETMPPEIEDGILALADQYERDPGDDG